MSALSKHSPCWLSPPPSSEAVLTQLPHVLKRIRLGQYVSIRGEGREMRTFHVVPVKPPT